MTSPATLYIVATPIGNLNDITPRALETLAYVDVIFAEDTRHSAPLLKHFNIATPMQSYHEHNEETRTQHALNLLSQGKSIALISDAGTPLISDPGFVLVKSVHEAGFKVSPVVGASAITAALCCCGLPTDRFYFHGFLPAKPNKRKDMLKTLRTKTETLVLYESAHRIAATLQDVHDVLGERTLCLAREMTKRYETIKPMFVSQWIEILENQAEQNKGEFVLVLAGNTDAQTPQTDIDHDAFFSMLIKEDLPLKQASRIAAQALGLKKNDCYQQLLALKAQ